MIAASDLQEYEPFGRQQIKNHPYYVEERLPSSSLPTDESILVKKFSDINVKDSTEETWLIREIDGNTVEEELYVRGRTAIVSRGVIGRPIVPSAHLLHMSYTMETPIRQALWTTFHSIGRDKKPFYIPSLCLLDSMRIRIYSESGEDYICPLQFEVASVWKTHFGILLERVSQFPSSQDETANGIPFTTFFSLLHPLNEITPMLAIKQGGVPAYMNDPCVKIVFTSTDPSLVVTVDLRNGLHSVWKLRKTSSKEVEEMNCSNTMSTAHSFSFSNHFSFNSIDMMNCDDANSTDFGSIVNSKLSLAKSVFFPCTSVSSGTHLSVNRNSHNITNGSPIFHSSTIGRLSEMYVPPKSGTKSGSPASVDARLATSQMMPPPNVLPTPIVPELCLEHLWTDQPPSRSSLDGSGITIKDRSVFLTTDLLGQQYLCFIMTTKVDTLCCARLNRANNVAADIIVGSCSYITARDAVPIPRLNMMAVLEPNASVILYTGPLAVGKVSLAGVTAELASSSYLNASASITSSIPSNYKRFSFLSSTVIGGGSGFFDERGLSSPVIDSPDVTNFHQHLPSSTPGSHVVSPITPMQSDRIVKLRDSSGFSLTVEFSNGSMYRCSLPDISSSSLVKRCVDLLKCILQKDDALSTLAKWYTVRNAPGTQDISPDLEWQLFIGTLLGLLGYEVDELGIMQQYNNKDFDTPGKATKKRRASDSGSQEDWEYLIKYGRENLMSLTLPKLKKDLKSPTKIDKSSFSFNSSAPLFNHIYSLLFSFHLIYEEIKLNTLMSSSLPLLARLLYQLACDLRLPLYAHHYWIDYPDLGSTNTHQSQIREENLANIFKPHYMTHKPPSIFNHVLGIIESKTLLEPYPVICGLNVFSKNILLVIAVLKKYDYHKVVTVISPPALKVGTPTDELMGFNKSSVPYAAVLMMHSLGITREVLDVLPVGIGAIIGDIVQSVCEKPLPGWPEEVYRMIGRPDMIPSHVNAVPARPPPIRRNSPDAVPKNIHPILSLRFNKDQRVEEVIRMLDSSEPVTIGLTQRLEVTDHEFIEEQERHLYAISSRTLALPVGRGIMDLHTEEPISSEPLFMPKICLTGRAPPRGTVVDLSHIDVVPNMTLWPIFHNGVAAGLTISPKSTINSTWIAFNRPKDTENESLTQYGGFLMALGLSGHLSSLSAANSFRIYEYLSKCHEMMSIGLLLGLAASKRGTMDVRTTKMFSVHLESLLPPTSIELDVSQNVQVASLLGIGLLYQRTGHRRMAEVLLAEIGRPPGPEMENSTDRECYSLTAGLALGLVVLGMGSNQSGLQDLGIDDTLHHYMIGGRKRPVLGSQKEKYKNPSYQIREEDRVNSNVTAPGAILALGLMYFDSGNHAVASWLESPSSEYMLSLVCPDILLLRMIAKGLILWKEIQPTVAWVESNVPASICQYCLTKPRPETENVDYETINQAYVNLIAGSCFALGLRFAGSANQEAFITLYQYFMDTSQLMTKSIGELIGKSTIETCINVILLSMAMVMAGTGDLEVVRLCRFLRSRVTNSLVTYGSHLATHMALGLLFIGGGAYSLSTTPEAVAALVISLFPRFPMHSIDNRYHLQAFRHLYVLAAEPRLLLPKDIETNQLCYADVAVTFRETPYYSSVTCNLQAPCLLPELNLLSQVYIFDKRYWPVEFERGENWDILVDMLKNGQCVGMKLRAGCLPHIDDPHGFRGLLSTDLRLDLGKPWSKQADSVLPYLSDPIAVKLVSELIGNLNKVSHLGNLENQHFQWLCKIAYDCVTGDTISLLKIWIDVLRQFSSLSKTPCSQSLWQMKLIIAHNRRPLIYNCHENTKASRRGALRSTKVDSDLILSFEHSLASIIGKWEEEIRTTLKSYCSPNIVGSTQDLLKLSCILIYYRIPHPSFLHNIFQGNKNIVSQAFELSKCGVITDYLQVCKLFK